MSLARAMLLAAVTVTALFMAMTAMGSPPSRILIAGDSTASDYPVERAPQAGWGQALPYFTADGVTVINRAVSGRSTKSYIDEGKWDALLEMVQAGDLVLISFGHNDSRDDAPERYAPADGNYRDNMVRFARDIEALGATPVILSPAAHRLWEGPAMVETHGLYALNAGLAADEAGAAFIDLSNASLAYFESLGREPTKQDFLWLSPENANARFPDGVEDNTHFTELGACGVARVVALALSGLPDAQSRVSVEPTPGTGDADGRPVDVLECAASFPRPVP
ncbi:rhamnogalacturonan acetylesterase [Marinihelvus fidelis]|nr:rhamnogalacturonan acetylesterase [Marinihelvus fidelis]